MLHNPALNLAPFSRWTLCDKAAPRSLRRSFWLGQVGATLSEIWPASVTPESVV